MYLLLLHIFFFFGGGGCFTSLAKAGNSMEGRSVWILINELTKNERKNGQHTQREKSLWLGTAASPSWGQVRCEQFFFYLQCSRKQTKIWFLRPSYSLHIQTGFVSKRQVPATCYSNPYCKLSAGQVPEISFFVSEPSKGLVRDLSTRVYWPTQDPGCLLLYIAVSHSINFSAGKTEKATKE